jgi:hypothetical protein
LLCDYVSVDRGDIAGHAPTDVDGAVDAGHVSDFVFGLDPNVMVDLEAIGIAFGGKHDRRQKNSDESGQDEQSREPGHEGLLQA